MINLVLLSIWTLFGFIVSSLFNLNTLPIFSIIFWIGAPILLYQSFRPNRDTWISCGIFLLSFLMVLPWFNDLLLAPSNDDTINHLGYLEAILRGNNALLGNINRPGESLFGEIKYTFYPTGSHAMAAIWIYPWYKFFNFNWVQLYKFSTILVIASWPVLLWQGSKIAFAKIPELTRFFLVAATLTLPTFPLWPLGEGGLARIFALVLIAPLWFQQIASAKDFKSGLIWTAVFTPTLLFIHPSVLPFIGLALLFFNRKSFWGAVSGGITGVIVFYFILHSAKQNVTDPDFMARVLAPIRNQEGSLAYIWFDRLKGPFHYWFSDPLGFGKFLSPKNWLVFTGIFMAIKGTAPRKTLALFAAPFLIAGISLIPHPVFDQAGLIYYHAVKRISELTPLLGFTIAAFAATHLQLKNWMKPALVVLSCAFIVQFKFNSSKSLDHYHELYHSPKLSELNQLAEKVRAKVGPDDVIIIDEHEYDGLRFVLKNPVYTINPECGETGQISDYCIKRKDWQKSLAGQSNVWSIPAILQPKN